MAEKKKSTQSQIDRDIEAFILKHPVLCLVVAAGVFGYLFRDKILSYMRMPSVNGGAAIEQTNSMISVVFQVGVLVVFIAAGVFLVRAVVTEIYNRKQFEYVRLLPHEDESFSVEAVNKLISRLHGDRRGWLSRLFLGREWFSYVIYREEETKEFRFYMGAHRKLIPYLKSSIGTVYSKCEFYSADDLFFPDHFLQNEDKRGFLRSKKPWVGGRMKIRSNRIKKALPLAKLSRDDLPAVMHHMPPSSWLQINFSAHYGRKIKRSITQLEKEIKDDKKAAARSSFEKEELAGLKNRFKRSDVAFDVTVSMATTEKDGVQHIKQMGSTINSNLHDVNELRYKKYRNSVSFYPKHRIYHMTWTGSELANLVHLPLFNERDSIEKLKEYIPRIKLGMELLPDHVFSNPNEVFVGYLDHPVIKERAVYIPKEVIGEHFCLIGRTGSGKSTVANNLLGSGFVTDYVKHDLSTGFTFADPAQETAFIILNRLLKAEAEGENVDWNKVHWINFTNAKYPVALNILYKIPGSHEGLIADAVTELIESVYDGEKAAVAERLLRFSIRTLLADPDETHTILEVQRLIDEPEFREDLLSKLGQHPENYDILNYWSSDGLANMKTSAVAVKNRIDMFASSVVLKRSFGQKGFDLDIRKAMDEGHIILLDVSDMNAAESKLIGGYLTYLFYRIAEKRPVGSNLHLLVFDEMARVGYISTQPRIISESRKRGLALGVSTQRLGQLNGELRDTLVNVQNNFFICGQGTDDAPLAAKALNAKDKKAFSASFLQNLEPRSVVIRSRHDNQYYSFLVKSPPLDKYKPDLTVAIYKDEKDEAIADEWTRAKVEELCSRRGKTAAQVDRDILKYMNPHFDFEFYEKQQEQPAAHGEKKEKVMSLMSRLSSESEKTVVLAKETEYSELSKDVEGEQEPKKVKKKPIPLVKHQEEVEKKPDSLVKHQDHEPDPQEETFHEKREETSSWALPLYDLEDFKKNQHLEEKMEKPTFQPLDPLEPLEPIESPVKERVQMRTTKEGGNERASLMTFARRQEGDNE